MGDADKTITLDVASQVNGWKQGQVEGEAFAQSNGDAPGLDQVEAWASERNPEADEAKKAQWTKGYVKGFKEGFAKGAAS